MSNINFVLPEFNVDNMTTSVSGGFFHEYTEQVLNDASHNLTLNVSRSKMNQIFLFYSDNTLGNDDEADLSDFSNTDLKFALNLEQWNPKIETTKTERIHVVSNLLTDLFGGGSQHALLNTDIFSNEEKLDNDISDIFQNRASQRQRDQVGISKNGYFVHSGPLKTATHQKILNASSSDPDSLTRQLLQTAALAARNDPTNTKFRRQFDITNTSNSDYNLPAGWRTFQFVNGDTFSYNLSIKQLDSFFPAWAFNQNALTGGSLSTSYRVKFIVTDNPTGKIGNFTTPTVELSQVTEINDSSEFTNIMVTNVTSVGGTAINVNDISVSTVVSSGPELLYETNVSIANVDFNTISDNTKSTIIEDAKQLYAQQLNINPASIMVILSSGSLKINITIQPEEILSSITLFDSSNVEIDQNTPYVDAGATALFEGYDRTNDLIIDSSGVNTLVAGSYNVYLSISGTSLSTIRRVTVIDTIPPIIQLVGGNITVYQGNDYNELGAQIMDWSNGSYNLLVGPAIISGDTVDTNTPGDYRRKYNGSDNCGNVALEVTRIVTVVDNIDPILQLIGNVDISINQNDVFNDPGAHLMDNGIQIGHVFGSGTVNTSIPDTYTITYSGSDNAGNLAETIIRRVTVVDNIAPIIDLSNDATISFVQDTSYVEYGASIMDWDGNSYNVFIGPATISGEVNTSVPGLYYVTYSGFDNCGNEASPVTRTVEIVAAVVELTSTDAPNVEITPVNNWTGDYTHAMIGQTGTAILSGDGSRIAIYESNYSTTGNHSGKVRVYNTATKVQVGTDIAYGDSNQNYFGREIAFNTVGDVLITGHEDAINPNTTSTSQVGAVRVYKYDGNDWIQKGQILWGEGGKFSAAVDINGDGNRIAVSAKNLNSGQGAVYVYSYDSVSEQWLPEGQPLQGSAANKYFGWQLRLSEDGLKIAVSEPYFNNTGIIRVYNNVNGGWVEYGNITGRAGAGYTMNQFGMSSDAEYIAVGDAGENAYTGSVKMYYYNGSSYQPAGDITGTWTNQAFGGNGVAMSSDATVILTSRNSAESNGATDYSWDAYVYIYDKANNTFTPIGTDGVVPHIVAESNQTALTWGYCINVSKDGGSIVVGGPAAGGDKLGYVGYYTLSLPPPLPASVFGTVPGGPTITATSHYSQIGNEILGEYYDKLPTSVAISSNGIVMAIGVKGNDAASSNTNADRGHVKVYEYSNNTWQPLGGEIDGNTDGDNFGTSVALNEDGTRVAIGVPGYDDGTMYNIGRVEIYDYNGTTWTNVGTIEGNTENGLIHSFENEQFGYSLAMSNDGTIIAVGAWKNSFDKTKGGRVSVYQLVGGSWLPRGESIYGYAANDEFGSTIALSANGMILAGGASSSDTNGANSGCVKVYAYIESSSSWRLLGSPIEGTSEQDKIGHSISLSSDGTIIAVGGTGAGNNDQGIVRVYEYTQDSDSWDPVGSDIVGENATDQFGSSVSLSGNGNILVVGAIHNDPPMPTNSSRTNSSAGHARIFHYTETGWIQIGNDIDGPVKMDNFGSVVLISEDGTRVVIGASLGYYYVRTIAGAGEGVENTVSWGSAGNAHNPPTNTNIALSGVPFIAGYARVYELLDN